MRLQLIADNIRVAQQERSFPVGKQLREKKPDRALKDKKPTPTAPKTKPKKRPSTTPELSVQPEQKAEPKRTKKPYAGPSMRETPQQMDVGERLELTKTPAEPSSKYKLDESLEVSDFLEEPTPGAAPEVGSKATSLLRLQDIPDFDINTDTPTSAHESFGTFTNELSSYVQNFLQNWSSLPLGKIQANPAALRQELLDAATKLNDYSSVYSAVYNEYKQHHPA